MFIETVKTPGVAHLSYVVGNNGQACVIDPRRDVECYLTIARNHHCKINMIFETHRNEDLISGSAELSARTKAEVFHGPNADGKIQYATTVKEGESFELGQLRIEVLETPGHTKDSLSLLLFDKSYEQGPVAVFTGDSLFVGDVGRTDFYPNEAEKVAGMLYDSLQKIHQRAAHALLYPAHGAGSVCGDNMAEREFSTVAHEFANNTLLQLERAEFIEHKINEFHYQPPYFSLMEQLNLTGTRAMPDFKATAHLSMSKILSMTKSTYLIDIRGVEEFRAAHIPGSLCLPLGLISAYAGWLLNPDDEFILLADNQQHALDAQLEFARIGFDHCLGFGTFSMAMLAASGEKFTSIDSIATPTVKQRLENPDNWILLDVRKHTEVEKMRIEESQHSYLGTLKDDLAQLPKSSCFTVLCGSGVRATVAASLLAKHGFSEVDVYLGSMAAWNNMRDS